MPMSYIDYVQLFHGKVLTEENFQMYIELAVDTIRPFTFDRLPEDIDLLEIQESKTYMKLKKCAYRVAEKLNTYDTAYALGVSSESTDGHSVSYTQLTEGKKRSEIFTLIRRYLGNTGLLYTAYNPYWDDRKW